MSATMNMNIKNLGEHPLICDRMTRIRDKDAAPEEFRRCVHEISQLMAYEVTKDFESSAVTVTTPLEITSTNKLARPIVLVPILRAGLGMLNGFLHILRESRIGHIGLFRNEETLKPESYYCNLPHDLSESEVILIDPMLATGSSSAEARGN